MSNPTEEFQQFNYDLTDFSWKKNLPSVTIECSEKINPEPKISVIIANFNNSDYLERMMDSLVNQTIGINHLQILFCDDRSTDDSLSKIKPFIIEYPNIEIYLLDKNTGGAHGPRNIGLLHARGKYLVVLDADDWYALDGLENMYNVLEKSGDNIAFGGVVRSKNGKIELMSPAYIEKKAIHRPILDLPYDFYNWLGPQGIMIRNELIKVQNLHFIDQRVADDVDFFYQILKISGRISQITDITTYVNRDDDNISLSKNINETFLRSWLRNLSYLLSKYEHSEDFQKFFTRRLEWILIDFTLRWDTAFGLNLGSIEQLKNMLDNYLRNLDFNPSEYFSLDVYDYIWDFLQTEEYEKLLKFVAWNTLPKQYKSLIKVEKYYYFVSGDKSLPKVNYPVIKGVEASVDDKQIVISFDYFIPKPLKYIEFRNPEALNHIFRVNAEHVSNDRYKVKISRTDYDKFKSGIYTAYVILEDHLEYLIAIDHLQIYCGSETLITDQNGVLNLYKPVINDQQILSFKTFDEKNLGKFVKVSTNLTNDGSFDFILENQTKISEYNYKIGMIQFPRNFDQKKASKYAFKAGIYRLIKPVKIYNEASSTALFLKKGRVLTVTNLWFNQHNEVLITTSAGSVYFDSSAFERITEPIEVVVLKNIYSYGKTEFEKNSRKKHLLRGKTILIKNMTFDQKGTPRFITESGDFITEKPEYVTFTSNLSKKEIPKTKLIGNILRRG